MPDKDVKDESYEAAMKRGAALDAMTRTEGWEVVKGHFEGKIQAFTNRLLIEIDKDISEFEDERQRLIGLRQLLLGVSNDIEYAQKENAKENSGSTGE